MCKRKTKEGFSIIELIVVIAIIGLLMSVVLFSVSEVRANARDKKRISDMAQYELALKLFYEARGRYPSSVDGTCNHYDSMDPGGCMEILVTLGLLPTLPKDPQHEDYSGSGADDQRYYYNNWCRDPGPGVDDRQFRIWANTENDHGGEAENWWTDYNVGVTTCIDPS